MLVGIKNPRAHLIQENRPALLAEINIKLTEDCFVRTLIDTGCSSTCNSETEIRRVPVFHNFEFCPQIDVGHAINGTDVLTVGLMKLSFGIGSEQFTVNSRVMRGLVRPVVLGWDFLCKYRAIIDLDKETFTIKGATVPFLKRETFPIVPHLSAFETVTIPPLSRMPIKAAIHAELAYIDSSASNSIITQPMENHCPVEGVFAGASISSISEGVTYCEIFNCLPTPVAIADGTPLATFEFMKTEDSEQFCHFANVDELTPNAKYFNQIEQQTPLTPPKHKANHSFPLARPVATRNHLITRQL